KASIEHLEAVTRTTFVNREPAPPSTRSCDAFRSAGLQATPPETTLGTGVAGSVGGWALSVGTTVGVGVGAIVGSTVGAAVGVAEQATRPRASTAARNGAAARVRALPRRMAMPHEHIGAGREVPRVGKIRGTVGLVAPTAKRGTRSGVAGKGRTVHGEAANAGHRVLAPDDAEVEAYLETALHAPGPERTAGDHPAGERQGFVAVLDFGSQFAQLIARRVRELNVYSELLPHDTSLAELERRGTAAVILSGGPNSVYDDDAPKPDPAIWSGRLPVLGICYGAQLMANELGGSVEATGRREYGPATVTIGTEDGLFVGLDRTQPVWMSHGDSITALPHGFEATAQTEASPYAGFADAGRHLYAIQFHPEVAHTPHGREVLRNFVVGVAGIAQSWTPASFIESTVAEI